MKTKRKKEKQAKREKKAGIKGSFVCKEKDEEEEKKKRNVSKKEKRRDKWEHRL